MTAPPPPLPEIVKKVEHGVVQIKSTTGFGSGFVVSENGYVITNAHVVTDSQSRIYKGRTVTVRFFDNVDVKGIVIAHGVEEQVDLACIHVDRIPFSTPLSFRNSNQVEVGEPVIALGYPLPEKIGHAMTVTDGIISAKHQDGPNAKELQTDAFITHGNSGGPLIDEHGKVIGINTHGLQPDPEKDDLVPGMNYAIASNLVNQLFPFINESRQTPREQPEPIKPQQDTPAVNAGQNILNGKFRIVPPGQWQIIPGPEGNFARFQSRHSTLLLSLSELESNLQTFANWQREIIETQAITWQSGKVDKLTPGNNPKRQSYHFECQSDFGDGKGVFQSRHYFSPVTGNKGKGQVLSATLTTAEGSPDHKAGLRLVLDNFLSRLQPGPVH